MRFFPPAIRTPVWEARMRNLERRRHVEDPLYQVATYLASLDQLFDEQASILREQIHRAEQAELALRMHQIRVAQAEARAAAAVSSEAVAQEPQAVPGPAYTRMDQKWNTSPGNWRNPCPIWDAHHGMGIAFWDPTSPTREP